MNIDSLVFISSKKKRYERSKKPYGPNDLSCSSPHSHSSSVKSLSRLLRTTLVFQALGGIPSRTELCWPRRSSMWAKMWDLILPTSWIWQLSEMRKKLCLSLSHIHQLIKKAVFASSFYLWHVCWSHIIFTLL